MELRSKDVYEVLSKKGIKKIYHANTVISSCQFLRHDSLLSRGTVERRKLFQTPQTSDDTDKSHGIWFDVFTDSVDIHHRANKRNVYGPVLFVISTELIAKAYTGKVWVTKLNPTKWDGKKHEERWFTSVDDLENNLVKGRFDQMIVFRHCGGQLPFLEYLEEVILDDPQILTPKKKVDYFSMAYGALRLAMTEGGSYAPINKRTCVPSCACFSEYKKSLQKTKPLFIPVI